MRNYKFMGQAAINPGSGFGGGLSPWGVGAMPSGWNYQNSQGGTLMTEQVNSPEHAYEEKHCYRSPSGDYVSIALGDRERYLAAGYVVVDTSNCGGAAMNGKKLGQAAPATAQATPPAAAPAPKLGTPAVLSLSGVGGALLGYALTFLPAFRKGKTKAELSSLAKFGALGGAIGGLTGAGTVMLLKD